MWNCLEKSSVTLGCLENPKQPRVALRWFLTVAPFACRRSWSRRRLRKGEREISALRTHKVLNREITPVTTWNPKYMPVPLELFCSAEPCGAEICSTPAHQPGSVWLCHQSQANVWLLWQCNGMVVPKNSLGQEYLGCTRKSLGGSSQGRRVLLNIGGIWLNSTDTCKNGLFKFSLSCAVFQ